MSEKRRRTGAVWCWPAAKFLHWKPRRREPHTPDTLRTRLRLNMLRYSVQKPHCPQCEGRDELEHLSQACGGAMSWSTSHRRAWHQPWACDDCRPLGLARLCFIASRRVPAPSRRLILCASGKTGGWEPRGVPLAHVLPNVAPHAVNGAMRPTCALSYAARVGLRANDSDPRHVPGEIARVRSLLRPAARIQGRCLLVAHCPHCFSRGVILIGALSKGLHLPMLRESGCGRLRQNGRLEL